MDFGRSLIGYRVVRDGLIFFPTHETYTKWCLLGQKYEIFAHTSLHAQTILGQNETMHLFNICHPFAIHYVSNRFLCSLLARLHPVGAQA